MAEETLDLIAALASQQWAEMLKVPLWNVLQPKVKRKPQHVLHLTKETSLFP